MSTYYLPGIYHLFTHWMLTMISWLRCYYFLSILRWGNWDRETRGRSPRLHSGVMGAVNIGTQASVHELITTQFLRNWWLWYGRAPVGLGTLGVWACRRIALRIPKDTSYLAWWVSLSITQTIHKHPYLLSWCLFQLMLKQVHSQRYPLRHSSLEFPCFTRGVCMGGSKWEQGIWV